jgi:hypothetical protein
LATSVKWTNDNQGVISVTIFVLTGIFGWATGIFSALARKPKFVLKLIPGPTFCCTFGIGKSHGEYELHRTGIALYLHVTNAGSAASSLQEVHVGYHWAAIPLTPIWWRYGIGWFWLENQMASLIDFHAAIGENIKVYPFLFQRGFISGDSGETFLQPGQSTNGVVYFEQSDSWGACQPVVRNGKVSVKVRVVDAYGGRHSTKFDIPLVSMEEARKYNPAFGQTLAQLRGEVLPGDNAPAAPPPPDTEQAGC